MNHYWKGPSELDVLLASDMPAGSILFLAGKAGILSNDGANGEVVAITIEGQVKVDNSGISGSAGDTIGYSIANKNAVGAGLGDFDIGIAVDDYAATDQIKVLLNAQ